MRLTTLKLYSNSVKIYSSRPKFFRTYSQLVPIIYFIINSIIFLDHLFITDPIFRCPIIARTFYVGPTSIMFQPLVNGGRGGAAVSLLAAWMPWTLDRSLCYDWHSRQRWHAGFDLVPPWARYDRLLPTSTTPPQLWKHRLQCLWAV